MNKRSAGLLLLQKYMINPYTQLNPVSSLGKNIFYLIINHIDVISDKKYRRTDVFYPKKQLISIIN